MSFCGGIGSRGGGEWLRWTGGVWQVEGGWKVYRDGVLMGGKKKRDGKIDFTAEHTDRPLAVSQTRAKIINHPYRYFFFFSYFQHDSTNEHTLRASRAGGCYFHHCAYKICLYTESLCQFALANSFWRKCNRRLIMFTGNVLTDPGRVPSFIPS